MKPDVRHEVSLVIVAAYRTTASHKEYHKRAETKEHLLEVLLFYVVFVVTWPHIYFGSSESSHAGKARSRQEDHRRGLR